MTNTAKGIAKTLQNTAASTFATATNEAQKRVETLDDLHSNATGTTKVIKAIKRNGKKTRRHINHLAKQIERSCGKAKNNSNSNSITIGGKRKSRKTRKGRTGKDKRKTNGTKKRMTKHKSKKHYKKRKTTKKSRS